MRELAPLMERSEVLRLARDALADHDPWIVGGTVRDLLLERPLEDVDLVVEDAPEATARALAKAVDGHVFPLSERFGAWRVVVPDAGASESGQPERGRNVDISPARGPTIESDLALRDFTINAMAVALSGAGPLHDPHGGMRDLERRLVRVIGARSYEEDPLRTMRMARLACELDFAVDAETRRLAAAHASGIARTAPERIFYELRKLVVSPAVLRGLELLDEAGLVAEVLPELEALKGVEQNPYHHLDVWGHTLAVLECLLDLERDLTTAFGEHADAVAAELDRPLADQLTRGQALRFAALLHDIGKPSTRRVSEEGRVFFWHHDVRGVEMCTQVCRRLRVSTALSDFLGQLTRHHLRLGFLVGEQPPSRHDIYRYLRSCKPVELEVTVLSAADRLATRGERTRQEVVDAHLGLARMLAGEALAWREAGPPTAHVSGDELMRELGLEPGPPVGRLLEDLREAAFCGEIGSKREAIERARASTTSARQGA